MFTALRQSEEYPNVCVVYIQLWRDNAYCFYGKLNCILTFTNALSQFLLAGKINVNVIG